MRASSIARVFDRLWPLFHKDPLEIFPTELMSLVLSELDPQDLLALSLVSKLWRERVTDSSLWKEKFGLEGWGLDSAEIERYEKEYNEQRSTIKQKRATSLNAYHYISSNAFGKHKVLANDFPIAYTPGGGSYSNEQHWTNLGVGEQAGTDRSPSEDEEMTDADVEQGSSRLNIGDSRASLPPGQTEMRLATSDIDTSHDHPSNKPLMMMSAMGPARVNYKYIFKHKRRLEDNWDKGRYKSFQLPHRNFPEDAHEECVYTIQYQGNYLVSGSRDRTLRIWNLTTGRLARSPLRAHVGSVLCLQFDSRPAEDIIVSGSSDTHVILWRFSTGKIIRRIQNAHKESVLNLRFDHRFLVTCSKDKTIKIWNRHELRPGDADYPLKGVRNGAECPSYIIDAPSVGNAIRYQPSAPEHLSRLDPYMHLMTLDLHGAAVNAIQIYKDQLVSASGDRNLRIWNIHTGECHSRIQAHEKGIACVQYDGKRIVSGSSDNSIRIWDPATRTEVARLEGHVRLVRTLQAAFADVPGGRERLEAEAQEVDRRWEIAKNNGEDLISNRTGRPARPGSRRPRDLRTRGAKIPPSGGGSRWGRIISGSYDEKIIIWKKNADDEWVISHQLAQEEALTAAGPPLLPIRAHVNNNIEASGTATTHPPHTFPTAATGSNRPVSGINPNTPDVDRLRLVQTTRQSPSHRSPRSLIPRPGRVSSDTIHSNPVSQPSNLPPNTTPVSSQASSSQPPTHVSPNQIPPQTSIQPAGMLNPPTNQGQANNHPANPAPRHPPTHNGAPPGGQPNARVFKLQFDARRIICCSQDNKIVGWDFANGDSDIVNCSRFFADPQ